MVTILCLQWIGRGTNSKAQEIIQKNTYTEQKGLPKPGRNALIVQYILKEYFCFNFPKAI